MSVEDHTVSFSLEVNIDKAYENIRKVQTVLYRTLGLLRRMGLGEDVSAAISEVQRFITVLNLARLTIAALQTATGPIGYAMFGISLATTGLSIGEMFDYQTRGR